MSTQTKHIPTQQHTNNYLIKTVVGDREDPFNSFIHCVTLTAVPRLSQAIGSKSALDR